MIELKGSKNQIAYAETIRLEKYENLCEYGHECELELKSSGIFVPYETLIDKIISRHTFSQWWIENKNNLLKYLFKELEIEVQKFLIDFDSSVITETLVIFDLHDTLSNVPFIDNKPLHVLPGRKEKLQVLKDSGKILACAANYGGVARGYVTEKEAFEEVKPLMKELGIKAYTLAFGYPNPISGKEQYQTQEELYRRKPEPGMPLELLSHYQLQASNAVMIGDAEEDEEAANKANIRFIWTGEFF